MKELWNKILRNVTITDRAKFQSTSVDAMALTPYTTSITVANGATTGKEAAIGLPANFRAMFVAVTVTTASTNAVNLVDIGDDVGTDAFVDGITAACNTTGYKGTFACNGTRGLAGVGADLQTPDEIEVVVSGNPGATGVTFRLTFLGVVTTQ